MLLVDSDIAILYGVTTKEVNQAVSNNKEKFPNNYIVELDKNTKNELVKKFDRFEKLKHSTVNPKAFTEKGLYMLATILKSSQATQATFVIIETFAKLKKLSRNLNSISNELSKEQQQDLIKESNVLLEEVIDIEPVREIKDDNITEVETKIELNLGFAKVSRVIKKKTNE